ncbi:hypothetical protein [Burkholderia gladioli]|uniref:Uncharacterized protein n=2 Tax=Burkholderia gladioli TaxID=28095 RepID=F2LKJ5_BURGS|nr:hypothetical protein [Burkholderia gladioli]AEA63197.1 hypothetical protein bgla_2g07260 [Burkholderia gladioli BSR3]
MNSYSMNTLEQDRPLSASEMSLARWMLEHGEPKAREFFEQLAEAEVTPWRRPCGCGSINFQIKGRDPAPPGVHILGDFIFGPDDEPAGIFIFESGGLLSGIEVYGLAGNPPAELPREDALRPFSSGGGESS